MNVLRMVIAFLIIAIVVSAVFLNGNRGGSAPVSADPRFPVTQTSEIRHQFLDAHEPDAQHEAAKAVSESHHLSEVVDDNLALTHDAREKAVTKSDDSAGFDAALTDVTLDPEERNDVAVQQVERGGAAVTAALCSMLEDERETPRWRNYCVQHLADMVIRHGDTEALTAVRNATLSDVPLIAEVACFSLARIAVEQRSGGSHVVEQLLARARDDTTDALVRTAALRGLALMDAKDARPHVEDLALDSQTPVQVRVAAFQALGVIGDDRTRARLGPVPPTAAGMLAKSHEGMLRSLDER